MNLPPTNLQTIEEETPSDLKAYSPSDAMSINNDHEEEMQSAAQSTPTEVNQSPDKEEIQNFTEN